MAIARRELLGLVGGAALGGALSPVPWKLLDDTAIWTQNWPWTPAPARGPISEKFGLCTLCAAGCGLKARRGTAGVFGIAPAAANPAGGGALCPVVYGAHQLPYHPRRLKNAMVDGNGADPGAAIAEAARRIKAAGTAVALIDERPGRILTSIYAAIARARNGKLLAIAQVEDRALRVVEELARVPYGSLGYDFEHAAVIVSIGAPLVDAWGSTGRMNRLWASRDAARPLFVHAGSQASRTAQFADRTLIIRPGSEAALVAALAGKLDADQAASMTGLASTDISELAALLHKRTPAVVLGGGEAASGGLPETTERMIAALNLSLGALGREGGIVTRRTAPEPIEYLDRVADHSLAVIVHDSSAAGIVVPEALVRKKLAPKGTLVRLTAFVPEDPGTSDILIPATSFLESADDASGARDAAADSWTYTGAISAAPAHAMAPAAFAAALAAALDIKVDSYETLRDARTAAIVAAKRGRLYHHATGEEVALSDVKAFQAAMSEGAVWVDDAVPQKPIAINAGAVEWNVAAPARPELVAIAASPRGSLSGLPTIPLASKLDRETRLYPVAGEVRMNPRTARALNLKAGDAVAVTTPFGETRGRVRCDASAIPGQLELAAGGDASQLVLESMGAGEPGPGSTITARIRRS